MPNEKIIAKAAEKAGVDVKISTPDAMAVARAGRGKRKRAAETPKCYDRACCCAAKEALEAIPTPARTGLVR